MCHKYIQKITCTSYSITSKLIHIISAGSRTAGGIQVGAHLPSILAVKHTIHNREREKDTIMELCLRHTSSSTQIYRYAYLALTVSVSHSHKIQPFYLLCNPFSSRLYPEISWLKIQQPYHLSFFHLHFLPIPPSYVEVYTHHRVRERTRFYVFIHT